MRNFSFAVVLAGLAIAPVSAMSQNMAVAPNAMSGTDRMLFMESGNKVPASAMDTVRGAVEAAKAQKAVRIEGRADLADAVKRELVRQGAPADTIRVRPVASRPLVAAGDGVSDPTERKVKIRF